MAHIGIQGPDVEFTTTMARYRDGSNSYECTFFSGPEIDLLWEDCVPFVQKSLDKSLGQHDIDYVYQLLHLGHGSLWTLRENGEIVLVAVVTFVNHQNIRETSFMHLGGRSLLKAMPFWPMFRNFMLNHGSYTFTAFGRPGFTRVLSGLGIKPKQTFYHVDVRTLI